MKMKKRRNYDAEFKMNAVALSEEPGRTARSVEKSLGIANGMIGKWKYQLEKNGVLAFPGNGIEALTPEQKQIKELEKKLRDTEMDRDILKKALAIFSKAPR
jgi:transposase-like protein